MVLLGPKAEHIYEGHKRSFIFDLVELFIKSIPPVPKKTMVSRRPNRT